MYPQLSATRICHIAAVALIFIIVISVSGHAQQAAPPTDVAGFFRETTGEWIGTVEQYTNGVKADTKYFHAVVRQTSPDTYEAVFDYYRIDKQTHAPVQVGVTNMTSKITPEGTAKNTITGKGDVFVDPNTLRHEEHTLSEILRMTPSGNLEGKGSGKISISGIALGAGKNGKVSNYTSTWALNNGIFTINEQLSVTFKALFFAKHYNIIYNFEGKRGSDIMGLMKSAGANSNPTSTTSNY